MSQKKTNITRIARISYAEQQQEIKQLKQSLANLDKILTEHINRSVDIETLLIRMSKGLVPLPSQQSCRVMALRLGTPKKEWSDIVANHQWQGGEDERTH